MSRRAARKAALQVLFQIDIGKTTLNTALDFITEENQLDHNQVEFVRSLVSGVMEHIDSLNRIINEVAFEWNMQRMAGVDRNILRMSLFELCYSVDVPPNVAVNEAIELGKTFGSAESGKFINGILGKVINNLDDYRQINIKSGV